VRFELIKRTVEARDSHAIRAKGVVTAIKELTSRVACVVAVVVI
jgi:hypothetical protein